MLAKRLGLDSVYLLYDAFDAGDVVGAAVPADGRASGCRDRRRGGLRRDGDFSALAARIARSGADGVLIGGDSPRRTQPLKALRARLGKTSRSWPQRLRGHPRRLELPATPPAGLRRHRRRPGGRARSDPAGQALRRRVRPAADAGYALQAAQATEVVLPGNRTLRWDARLGPARAAGPVSRTGSWAPSASTATAIYARGS